MLELDIDAETEQRITSAARALGMDPGTYIAHIVTGTTGGNLQEEPASGKELQEMFRALAAHSSDIPDLPDHAYTRESFYEDHD